MGIMPLFAFIVGLTGCHEPPSTQGVQVDAPLYDFEGNEILLQDYFSQRVEPNKPLLVNFWEYVCEPCRDEFDDLGEINSNRVSVLGAHVQFGDTIEESLDAYKLIIPKIEKNVPYENRIILFNDYEIFTTAYELNHGTTEVPYSILLCSDGSLYQEYRGSFHEESLQQYLSDDLANLAEECDALHW